MKLLTIIYDSAIDNSLTALLEELNVGHWTKFSGIPGQGESGIKVNSPVWPGSNNIILVADEDESVRSLAEHIRTLQDEFKLKPGVFMYLQPIETL